MRTPALHFPPRPPRRGTPLTLLSLALAAGLAGCSGAGPTEPGSGHAMDPAPVVLHQPSVFPAAARTSSEISQSVLLPICPVRRRLAGAHIVSATDIRVCATTAQADGR